MGGSTHTQTKATQQLRRRMSNKIILEKLRRNLNTDLLLLTIFQERVVTFSRCNYTVREKKKTLDIAVLEFFQYLPLDDLFHFDHDQVHDEVNMCTS